jgi:hypothetical protein
VGEVVFLRERLNFEKRQEIMKLENISKIFGVLAFMSFIAAIWEMIVSYGPAPKYSLLGATVIFLLAAIMTTLKRIARATENSGKE